MQAVTEETNLISAVNAGKALASAAPPRSAIRWTQWLTNNRNAARRAGYRIPYERIGGRVYYRRADLDAFIEFQNQRLLGTIQITGRVAEIVQAYGLGQSGTTGTGRPFNLSQITAQVDHFGDGFAQLVLSDPLTIYRLSLDDCTRLRASLDTAISEISARQARHTDT